MRGLYFNKCIVVPGTHTLEEAHVSCVGMYLVCIKVYTGATGQSIIHMNAGTHGFPS